MDRTAALPVAVDERTDSVRIDLQTGERRADAEFIYSEYQIGRFRAGYACFNCQEPFEEAFPLRCPVCGLAVRDRQAGMVARELRGYTTIGPDKTLAQLRAEDDEARAREARRREKPTSRIWIP